MEVVGETVLDHVDYTISTSTLTEKLDVSVLSHKDKIKITSVLASQVDGGSNTIFVKDPVFEKGDFISIHCEDNELNEVVKCKVKDPMDLAHMVTLKEPLANAH